MFSLRSLRVSYWTQNARNEFSMLAVACMILSAPKYLFIFISDVSLMFINVHELHHKVLMGIKEISLFQFKIFNSELELS